MKLQAKMDAPSDSTREKMCEIEATVVTGFEQFAKEEIQEKLDVSAWTERGKVNFRIPLSETKQVLQLSSIDNAYVVIKRCENFQFADDVESILQQFRDLIPSVDWQQGLQVWSEVFSFKHPISPGPATTYRPEPPEGGEPAGTLPQPEGSPSGTDGGDAQAEVEPLDKNVEEAATTEPAAKKVRETSWNPLMPAFRVTCYRSGKHIFQSPQAAANFGGEINNYFGWNVDMKKFDIEVILVVEGNLVYVCLGLTRESLHKRNLTKFGPTTLRPTIAYNILRFSRIKDFEVVCDPMCGGGSIPIEAALNWPNAIHLCGDVFDQASVRAKENMDIINEKRTENGKKAAALTVFRWDATNLPLKDESVDVVITDMPFGKRSGSKLNNWQLYPQFLRDIARVCKRETGRACLMTQDRKCITKSLMSVEGLWRRGPQLNINIGGLAAGVYLLYRTARKFLSEEELRAAREDREQLRRQWEGQSRQMDQSQQRDPDAPPRAEDT